MQERSTDRGRCIAWPLVTQIIAAAWCAAAVHRVCGHLTLFDHTGAPFNVLSMQKATLRAEQTTLAQSLSKNNATLAEVGKHGAEGLGTGVEGCARERPAEHSWDAECGPGVDSAVHDTVRCAWCRYAARTWHRAPRSKV